MANVSNVLDPVEKLSELRQWMLENKVTDSVRKSSNSWVKTPTTATADAEVAEFQRWLQDIQNNNPALAW
jgi:hypothetical protein